ncbi:hypothetical protein [Nocardia sp. NPDC004123]
MTPCEETRCSLGDFDGPFQLGDLAFCARITRADSVVVSSVSPASTAACLIYFRSVSAVIPSWAETVLIAAHSLS